MTRLPDPARANRPLGGAQASLLVVVLGLGLGLAGADALAQRPPGEAPAAGQAPPAAEPSAPQRRWEDFPQMVLERVYRGPLRDTLVQRWRDPGDGSICFVYLPINASAAGQGQYLLYGPNTIGSISCHAPAQIIQLQGLAPPAAVAQPAAAPPASAPAPAQPPRGR